MLFLFLFDTEFVETGHYIHISPFVRANCVLIRQFLICQMWCTNIDYTTTDLETWLTRNTVTNPPRD